MSDITSHRVRLALDKSIVRDAQGLVDIYEMGWKAARHLSQLANLDRYAFVACHAITFLAVVTEADKRVIKEVECILKEGTSRAQEAMQFYMIILSTIGENPDLKDAFPNLWVNVIVDAPDEPVL